MESAENLVAISLTKALAINNAFMLMLQHTFMTEAQKNAENN